MKWLRKFRTGESACPTWRFFIPNILLIGVLVVAARAELAHWVENIEPASRLESVFFKSVSLPGGPVLTRKPPKETRPELTKLIASAPTDADLYSLRALEEEEQLDAQAAEADWKKYAELSKDKVGSSVALADFYHRRLRPNEELAALASAAREPSPPSERLLPAAEQTSWKLFDRMMALAAGQAMPPATAIARYRAWILRYPAAPEAYTNFFRYALEKKQTQAAEEAIAAYQKAFPGEQTFPVTSRAQLAGGDRALAVYDAAFRPLWPPDLVKDYFTELKDTKSLGRFLAAARSSVSTNPLDLGAAARIFYYYQQQGNLASAQRALTEFRQRKERGKAAWTADELFTLAQLFEGAHNYDEAAREYYALYSLPGGGDAAAERGLTGLTRMLLDAPDQPIQFGAGDLSLYRDIAAMDRGPGFLNGILSLILNTSYPNDQYAQENRAAASYFHRARASELLAMVDRRFPKSPARPELYGRLIAAYATYGANDGVIAAGRQFLASFPSAQNRTEVAMRLADAYARANRTKDEFADYEDMLKELAARADGVPLGEGAGTPPAAAAPATDADAPQAKPQGPAARSPQYARVLDRYISRLVALKRIPDALSVYRRELDRNPNDAGLYERLAAFLEQNRLGTEVEQVYRKAIQQFPDRSWNHKLARWYLRHKETAQFQQLTDGVSKTFSGTDLEAYFSDVVPRSELPAALYRQLNLFAHRRFPHNLTFVRNLLGAYQAQGTADPAAYEKLLRENWPYAEDLRAGFFELLSRTHRLDGELAAVTAANNSSAASRFLAEGEAWRCHFENAAPLFVTLEADDPGDVRFGQRTASMERSLAAFDRKHAATAASIEDKLARFRPRDSGPLTRIGEIYSDYEQFDKARPFWDRIATINPGQSGGYLDTATVFWDYFRYDDALRVVGQARQKLADPALFAYEAGAIFENQRNYERAIAEYLKGAVADGDNPARARLLVLARRPALRENLDRATSALVAGANPDAGAVSLRVALLRAENRRDDLGAFLAALAGRATSYDLLVSVENTARVNGFDKVQTLAVQREVTALADPLERLRRRLALARLYESQGQSDAAAREFDALYHENPKTLGVIRAAVDYYWRNKNSQRAIAVLTEAAAAAQPEYSKQFTFEAARKATDAGDYTRARTLLGTLLSSQPFRGDYLAAVADTYGRQNDDRGLRDFYTAKLTAIRTAPFSAEERQEKIAGLRRGLIGVLTRLQDFNGAVDQYIEIVNRFPEDEDLTREAASYAGTHGLNGKLTAYYEKTISASPRDARWPVVLARVDTQLEDLPGAIANYDRAAGVRPDRTDLYIARAGLEARLLRFDDAARDYRKIYDLTYNNSQWLEKIAETRARQGQADAAVAALRKAFIDGRPDSAGNYFTVAARLESWNFLTQARQFAEEGLKRAADGDESLQAGLGTYARVMTRLREYDAAWIGMAALKLQQTPIPWNQIAGTVATCFAPEEKAAFAAFLAKKRTAAAGDPGYIALAQAAGLYDLEARWRYEFLLANAGQPAAQMHLERLTELERQRLKFSELGAWLEGYWKAIPADQKDRDAFLGQAADAYRSAGDSANELRALSLLAHSSGIEGDRMARYMQLTGSQGLIALASPGGSDDTLANAAVATAIARGNARTALDTVIARGKSLPPVWTKAYTALTGLYFANTSEPVKAAFSGALGLETIGGRIGKPADRAQQLTGDIWFYYGSRYGEYLAAIKQNGAEDYLPASLEATPGRPAAYFELAEYYRGAGDRTRALEEYRNALQLDSDLGAAHARVARLLFQDGRKDEAVAEWKTALASFEHMQDRGRAPQEFWKDVQETLTDIGSSGTLATLRADADKLLRTYVRRNGNYMVDPLFEGALAAAGNPQAGVAWIVDLAGAAGDPSNVLAYLLNASWITDAQRGVLYQRLVELARAKLAQAFGDARVEAQSRLESQQLAYLQYLLDRKETEQARLLFEQIGVEARQRHAFEYVSLQVRLAARTGTLPALAAGWTRDPDKAPTAEILRQSATELATGGDTASSIRVLEFVYRRELDQQHLDQVNFLGLAEVRLQQKDVAGALALLHRMTVVSAEPFDALVPAADLLQRTGHRNEAIEFLTARVKAVPWDWDARRSLAAARQSKDDLKTVASAREAAYGIRVQAASELRGLGGAPVDAGSVELNLLAASAPIQEQQASLPFFYSARVTATASLDPAARIRVLSEALAIDPAPTAARLSLFQAAMAARRYALAVSVYQYAQPTYPAADVQRGLGEAYEHLGLLAEAERNYSLADSAETRIAQRAAIRAALKAVREQIQLQTQNAARRPAVGNKLEQDHPVRPRLLKPPSVAESIGPQQLAGSIGLGRMGQ